jgi:alanine racemase
MSTIYLHKKNLFDNLNKISKTNPNILCVIKDNAYGHSIFSISKILKEYGIKKVCVKNLQEAEIVKNIFEEVIIFYPHTGRGAKNFSYCINSISQLKKNRHPYIHLKIDTGMHRNGIEVKNIQKALEIVKEKEFEIRGVFTHLCCAESDEEYTLMQYEKFKSIKKQILEFVNKYNLKKPYFHIANSKGLEILPETFDYVRPGIAIYGGIEGYKPVMELRADVISTRLLKKDEGVGYDKKFIASSDMIISTIDVGYGDGIPYFREGIKLKNANAFGKISMDSMIVEGEFKKEVVVFDDIKEFAKNFDTITYDILVKMSPRIKRVIV